MKTCQNVSLLRAGMNGILVDSPPLEARPPQQATAEDAEGIEGRRKK
jgi:hypothetical protein